MTPSPAPPGSSWWAGVPPVEVTLECRGRSHRLRWEDGELTTPDHPGAGRRPPVKKGDPPRSAAQRIADDVDNRGCVTVARGWRVFRTDPRVLVLGRRHPGETLDPVAADASDDPLARVLVALGPALERRLQLEVAATVAKGWTPGQGAILEAATVGRLTKALGRWLEPGHRAVIELAERSAVTDIGGTTIVRLAPTWLAQVWGRYLTLVDGFLVLEVNRVVENRAEVIGLGRPGGEPARLTLRGPAPWRAVDRQALDSPQG